MKKAKLLLLLFLSLFFSFIIAEIALRIFPWVIEKKYQSIGWNHWTSMESDTDRYRKSSDLYNSMYISDSEVGYVDSSIIQQINQKALENSDEKYSILVLGDSVSATGYYVSQLEAKLDETYGDEVEILNAGVIGYDTKLEELFLKKYGFNYNPDLVILQFNINDFSGTPVFIKNVDNSWEAFNANKAIKNINPIFFGYSKVYQLISTFYLDLNKEETDYYSVVAEPLKGIVSYLENSKTDLIVVYFPKFEVSDDAVEKHTVFSQIIQDLQLEEKVLDLTQEYQQFEISEVSLDPTHPNEKGDIIASEKIYELLKEKIDLFTTKAINEL